MRWRKVDPPVVPGGDVGGDFQVTDSYSARFRPAEEPADGVHALVTVYFYGGYAEMGERSGPPPAASGYVIERQTEFLLCEDPQDPGGTERWSDYTYEECSDSYPTPEAAEKAARALAMSVDDQVAGAWDGRSTDR